MTFAVNRIPVTTDVDELSTDTTDGPTQWRTDVRSSGTADDVTLVTEKAVRDAVDAGGGGGSSVQGLGIWSLGAATSPPVAAGTYLFNNTDASLATVLYISDFDQGGVDKSNLLNAVLEPGVELYLQQSNNSNNYWIGEVTSRTDQTGYVMVEVTNVQVTGTITAGVPFIFYAIGGGGGGGGGSSSILADITLDTAKTSQTIELPAGTTAVELIVNGANGAAAQSSVKSYLNGDTTDSNYWSNEVKVLGASASLGAGAGATPPINASVNPGEAFYHSATWTCGPSRVNFNGRADEWDGTDNVSQRVQTGFYKGTNPAELTQLDIVASQTNGLAAGTRILVRDLTANGAALAGYSTTEQPTGETWIDGKDLYRKVVELTNKPNASGSTNAHGIASLGTLVDASIIFNDAGFRHCIASNPVGNTTEDENFSVDDTNVYWSSGYNRSTSTDAYAIIEYTKT